MSRFKLIVAEAVRSLGANISTTFAATTTVLIGMFMLGLVVGLGSWALSLGNHYKGQLLVKVFLCAPLRCDQEATTKQINDTRARLASLPGVKTIKYISTQDAYRIMQKKNPEMVRGLTSNPFPAEFEVIPKRGEDVDKLAALANTPPLPGVEKICPPPPGSKSANTALGEQCNQITHRVLSVANYLWVIVLIAFIVLMVSSTLLVANTIRLSIFSRRREIEVMKLVGATNWFVRGPFMIEGLLCGLAGAVGAIILLLLGRTLFMPLIHLTSASDVHAWPFGLHVLVVLGAGLALGAAGSGLTIRRFLQV
jgi:cell division transport system permease protein